MHWQTRVLVVVVAAELAVGFVLLRSRPGRVEPPLADLTLLDAVTAAEIRSLHQAVIRDASPGGWRRLGEAYAAFGYFPEAEACCRRAVELDPNSFAAHDWHGVALNQVGRTEDAIEAFERAAALSRGPDRQQCLYHIGRNYLRQENPDKAEAAFRKAGNLLWAAHELARLLIRTDRASEALEILDPLVEHYPQEQRFYQLRARARTATGDHEAAARDSALAERSPHLLPTAQIVYRLHTRIAQFGLRRRANECRKLIQTGKLTEAAAKLRELLAIKWRAAAASNLVSLELLLGTADAAIRLLDQLNERHGTSPERLSRLGDAWSLAGNQERAIDYWARAAAYQLNVEPGGTIDTQPFRQLAQAYAEAGDQKQSTKFRSFSSHFEGIVAFRNNQMDLAAEKLEESVSLDAHKAKTWYYLGLVREAQDEPDGAQTALRRCLEIAPNHGRARDVLKRLGP